MWPLPKVHPEQVCLSLTGTEVTYAWITATPCKSYMLQAYETHHYQSNRELVKQINSFIKKHSLNNTLLNVALSTPLIHEQFVRLPHASPTPQEMLTPALKKMIWDYRYIHTHDNGESLFYRCGIERPTLFAHQLLAHQLTLNLMNLTSSYMALINAYNLLFGAAFRRSQLAIDLLAHNYELEKSISTDSVARILRIPSHLSLDLEQQKVSVLTMIGLFNRS